MRVPCRSTALLSSARDQQIQALFQAALERPPSERATFVAALTGEDRELRQSVELLLSKHDTTDVGARRWDNGVSWSASLSQRLPGNIHPYVTYAESSIVLDANKQPVDKTTGQRPEYITGVPFPDIRQDDPEGGYKIIWNLFYAYYTGGNSHNETVLHWILAASFAATALWTLVPDKMDDDENSAARRFGPFVTTLIAFFLAEIGDKTQVATVMLAAQYPHLIMVILGTTLGMLIANVPVVLAGNFAAEKLPLTLIRRLASAAFFVLAAVAVYSAMQVSGWIG